MGGDGVDTERLGQGKEKKKEKDPDPLDFQDTACLCKPWITNIVSRPEAEDM